MTKYCVRCGKPAKFACGHIIKESKNIIAGWCSKRCAKTPGFSGHWLPFMGALAGLLLSVGVAQAESGTDSLKVISPTYGLLSINMVPSTEPIAQMPLSEFKQLIVRVDKLKQREKLQAELIGHLQEKGKVQTEYIEKIEQANETIQAYASKLEEVNAQLVKQAEDKQLSTLAEGAGYGATAAAVIGVVVRKLILKF